MAFQVTKLVFTSSKLISIPEPLKSRSTVFALKERLEWGEPALTIIDVRHRRDDFNAARISGALSMPMDELVVRASASLEVERDIYVYGESNEQTAEAATQLREAGYKNVAELIDGLPAWKKADGPVEGSFAVAA